MRKYVCTSAFFMLFVFFSNAQAVKTAGKAKNVMQGVDLSAHINLGEINQNDLIGLGPVHQLQGEITAFKGIIYKSAVSDAGEIITETPTIVQAPFFVYDHIQEWEKTSLEVEINSLNELQDLIIETLAQNGFDINQATPFWLKGEFKEVTFHIIRKDLNEAEHSHEKHKKSKVMFKRKDVKANLVGFYSQKHQGVFTHKGQFIHVHYLDDLKTETGHLDNILFDGRIEFFFPKAK